MCFRLVSLKSPALSVCVSICLWPSLFVAVVEPSAYVCKFCICRICFRYLCHQCTRVKYVSLKSPALSASVCICLWPSLFVAVMVCGRHCLCLSLFVAIMVCSCYCLCQSLFVAVIVCGRRGLWPSWFVPVIVCGRHGLWPSWFVPVIVCARHGLCLSLFVAVIVCDRQCLCPYMCSRYLCRRCTRVKSVLLKSSALSAYV